MFSSLLSQITSTDIVSIYKKDVNEFISTVTGGTVTLDAVLGMDADADNASQHVARKSISEYMKKSWFEERITEDEMMRCKILLRETESNLDGYELWQRENVVSDEERKRYLEENPEIAGWIEGILGRDEEGKESKDAQEGESGEAVDAANENETPTLTKDDLWNRFSFRKWLREKEDQQISANTALDLENTAWDDDDETVQSLAARVEELEERLRHYQLQLKEQVEQNHVLRKDLALDEKQKEYVALLERHLKERTTSSASSETNYNALSEFVRQYPDEAFQAALREKCAFVVEQKESAETRSTTESTATPANTENSSAEHTEESVAGDAAGEDDDEAFDWE